MRKPLALMLAGLMAVSMVGCGSNGDAASSSDNKDKADSGKCEKTAYWGSGKTRKYQSRVQQDVSYAESRQIRLHREETRYAN